MKNKILYIIVFLFISLSSTGQGKDSLSIIVNDKVFTAVEKEAKFPGGADGWKKYLETNLRAELANRYIRLKKDEQEVTQTAIVQFIVNNEGKVSNVTITNPTEVHPKLAAEAIRVIKEGPVWEPATQNGRKVIYQARQYVTFLVSRE